MDKQNSTKIKLADFLPYRLSVLSNHISRAIESSYKSRFELSMPEWRVMAIVADEQGLSAGEVAAKAEMDKVAVSRAVTKLIQAKRLKRQFSKSDKRKSALFLSKEGLKVYEQIVPIAKSYEAAFLGKLSADDQAKLGQLLRRMSEI